MTGLLGAIRNIDPITGQQLNLSTGQRWVNGIFGAVQLGGLFAYSLGNIMSSSGAATGNGLGAGGMSISDGGASAINATWGMSLGAGHCRRVEHVRQFGGRDREHWEYFAYRSLER